MVHVRVQTATGHEGAALTATEAVKEACTTLENQCDFVLEELEKVLPEVREDREWMEQLAAEELQQAAEEEEDEEE